MMDCPLGATSCRPMSAPMHCSPTTCSGLGAAMAAAAVMLAIVAAKANAASAPAMRFMARSIYSEPASGGTFRSTTVNRLHVEVQCELVRSRPDLSRLDLLGPLVLDPRLDEIGRENAALREVFVVLFEHVDHCRQRRGRLWNVGGLVRRQLVQILVYRSVRLDLVLDPVEAGHHHRGEREVRVARAVGATELEALGLRVVARDRN